MNLEDYFSPFRKKTIGWNHTINTPMGTQPLIYADWIASGRLYEDIEDTIRNQIGPMVANTHSEASATGKAMTRAYHLAGNIIKNHVNAGPEDVLISAGSGMTAVVNKLQRMLGLRRPPESNEGVDFSRGLPRVKPSNRCDTVVFITHMEHHSNHISWLESCAEVVVLEPDDSLQVNPEELERKLKEYEHTALKIGSFSAASNVTGFIPPYRELARIMHRHGGYAFVDFAASAPYVDMDMHPEHDQWGYLDGIFFSPHKFLGGPGSSGVLVFNRKLYHNRIPDNPGGGTVNWTNRWGERSYVTDIEAREDGGTPPFLQTMRTALAIRLKEQMGVKNIAAREKELLQQAVKGLSRVPGLQFLGADGEFPRNEQLAVLSFFIRNIHHNLIVALLNDRFGIQVRGGCSCAGTYGHWLLHVSREDSLRITREIERGDLSEKPGWVRISLHPTMSNGELDAIIHGVHQIASNAGEWEKDYRFNPKSGEFDYVPRDNVNSPSGGGAVDAGDYESSGSSESSWFDL